MIPFSILGNIGSLGSKLVGIGMTALGLRRLWSEESRSKHSPSTLVGFSATYALHMGSTSLATAVWCGSTDISPRLATAFVNGTSLMSNYANLLEAYFSHQGLLLKQRQLSHQRTHHELELNRHLALMEGISECEAESATVGDQLLLLNEFLKKIQAILDPNSVNGQEKLKTIYITLAQHYQERNDKESLLHDYFKTFSDKEMDMSSVLLDLGDKIEKNNQTLSALQEKQKQITSEKAQTRIQNRMSKIEQTLKEYGSINIQCIRYLKIEKQVKILEELLENLKTVNDSSNNDTRQSEESFLMGRLQQVKQSLQNCLSPQSSLIDLELGDNVFLDDYISGSPHEFKAYLEKTIQDQIALYQTQADALQTSTQQIQQCFRLYIRDLNQGIPYYREKIKSANQDLIRVQSELSLEKFNKEARNTKFNISTLACFLVFILYAVPDNQFSSVIQSMMLGVGIMGGISSVWQFYQRNLTQKKAVVREHNQTQCLQKDFDFHRQQDLVRTDSAQLEKRLAETEHLSIPARVKQPLVKRTLPKRDARETAKNLIFSSYHPARKTPSHVASQRANNRGKRN